MTMLNLKPYHNHHVLSSSGVWITDDGNFLIRRDRKKKHAPWVILAFWLGEGIAPHHKVIKANGLADTSFPTLKEALATLNLALNKKAPGSI